MLSIDELEIIKSALEGDILRQKKFLNELAEQGGSDIRFEIWMIDSQKLLEKVTLKLMNMKAKQ